VTGNTLQLSWGAEYINTGWLLQVQTNPPSSSGLSANWVNVAGSDVTNQIFATISQTNGSVFYRLIYP
jgi:hypothetical protein